MGVETYRGAGPAEVLASVFGRLGNRVEPTLVAARFSLHDDPSSLLALVHVARDWGYTARAFQGELANLGDAVLPAIVHLRSPLDGEESFGVLVGAARDAYELEDPITHEVTRLDAGSFASAWTGVIVTFESPERPVAPPRDPGPLARWWTLARVDRQAAALLAARAIGTLGIVLLGLGAAARLSARPPLAAAAAALIGLDLLVAATCIVLFHASRRTRVASATPRLAQRICGRGGLGDCEGVLGSKWARIGGFDLPVLGLAFAASNVILAGVLAIAPPPLLVFGFGWIAAAHLLAAPASLFFIGLQVWPLKRFCPLCMTVHAGVLAGAAMIVVTGARAWEALTPPMLVLVGAIHVTAFLAVAGLVVPLLELGIESRASRSRLAWVAATPWGALAEAAGRTRAFSSPPASAFRLGRSDAPFRIDALVHPFCSGCGPVVEGLVGMTSRRADTVQVAFHLAPRDPKDPGDLAMCAGVSAIGLLAGGEQTIHVFRTIKGEPRKYLEIARGGADRLVAAFMPPSVDPAAVLPAAAEAVERAAALADALRTGTPTLLLNGRVWESTLDDLDVMIGQHPAIVAAVLR
ncbi:MAG TPA: vitamin K epoxide reductase family protein [Candidatus Polarisedimenticolaceae bacterium]|nr:vitamin K epoxide reductase family protein [Candidatus Polarisedimenticolaceae bacterium]